MQYILVQTETKRVTAQVQTDNGLLDVDTLVPGELVLQCISISGTTGYRTLAGEPFDLIGGSHVVDANPAVPSWDVPELEVVEAVPQPVRSITKLDYMNRFHDAELVAIYSAAKTVIQIEVWLEKFKVSEQIMLDDPRTASGLRALEQYGLIGAGRADEILA